MQFSALYDIIPFTMSSTLTPIDPSKKAYWLKKASVPGSDLLKIPTVVVDVSDTYLICILVR